MNELFSYLKKESKGKELNLDQLYEDLQKLNKPQHLLKINNLILYGKTQGSKKAKSKTKASDDADINLATINAPIKGDSEGITYDLDSLNKVTQLVLQEFMIKLHKRKNLY